MHNLESGCLFHNSVDATAMRAYANFLTLFPDFAQKRAANVTLRGNAWVSEKRNVTQALFLCDQNPGAKLANHLQKLQGRLEIAGMKHGEA